MPDISAEGTGAMRHTWLELHGEWARLSTNSDHRIVDGAGHYTHWDRPEAVVDAILDVVTAVREGGVVTPVREGGEVRKDSADTAQMRGGSPSHLHRQRRHPFLESAALPD